MCNSCTHLNPGCFFIFPKTIQSSQLFKLKTLAIYQVTSSFFLGKWKEINGKSLFCTFFSPCPVKKVVQKAWSSRNEVVKQESLCPMTASEEKGNEKGTLILKCWIHAKHTKIIFYFFSCGLLVLRQMLSRNTHSWLPLLEGYCHL